MVSTIPWNRPLIKSNRIVGGFITRAAAVSWKRIGQPQSREERHHMSPLHERPAATSPATRKTMQANRSKNTKPELELRRLLREAGCPGYRLHWKVASGHPDIAYPGRKIAIFVNGCFWHRCPHCAPAHPTANYDFWAAKFEANRRRDDRQYRELAAAGWRTAIVWECQLRHDPNGALETVLELLRNPHA